MTLIDSHCHLQDPQFDLDRLEVLERALEELAWLVVVGDDLETSRQAVAITRDRMFATVGIHPYYADSVDADQLDELRALAEHKQVVAIGEIGLDYHRKTASITSQRRAFRMQLEAAAELGLPVVVHNRDAHDDVAAVLDECGAQSAGGVMHCFDGDAVFVERCLGWGFYISFAGNLTYPNAHALREAAQAVPMDRLFVETDCPYLAPQPVRGKRCEPQFVRYTAEALAALKGVTTEVLAAHATSNAARLFRVGVPVEEA
jgi:TatD DNase family protein